MIKKLQHIICFLWLLACYSSSFGQGVSLTTSINRDHILIGEPIEFRVEAVMPLGLDPQWPALDTIPHFELIGQPRIDTLRKVSVKSYTRTLTLTSFDSGRWLIPSMPLEIDGKTYMTDSLPVTVAFSEFNAAQDYHDIRDIIDVRNPGTGYINWVIGAITVIALGGLIYFLRERAAARQSVMEGPLRNLSPIEEALRSLEELRKQELTNGQIKQYYTRLNDILRLFLLRRLNMPTLEKTNDELILQVKQLGIHNDVFVPLAQSLRMSDAVKFAKYSPDGESNEQNFSIVRNSIELINDLDR